MNYYLNRFALREQLIKEEPHQNLGLIVVIPCCNETELVNSLQSLADCTQAQCYVEVIVVINASEQSSETVVNQNQQTLQEAVAWSKTQTNEKLSYFFIEENCLPTKHAGVGLARKIGMDEAVRRFDKIENHNGVIICFDADSQCEPNYLVAIEQHFLQHPKTPACSIHFEHPISGDEFLEQIYNGIAQYELHLRYYKNGLAYAGLPYAYHTIGSSMAVRSSAYQKQNGMNQRKAGEDFYFLQKLIPLGNFTEIKTTKVMPSPRVSDRVPFGTGRAMQNWLNEDKEQSWSYHPNSFIDLKAFSSVLHLFYEHDEVDIPLSVKQFLEELGFKQQLQNIRKNSTSDKHFKQLFYNWFNAFKVLKYMHFTRDNFYADIEITKGANTLLELLNHKKGNTLTEVLEKYRALDLM